MFLGKVGDFIFGNFAQNLVSLNACIFTRIEVDTEAAVSTAIGVRAVTARNKIKLMGNVLEAVAKPFFTDCHDLAFDILITACREKVRTLQAAYIFKPDGGTVFFDLLNCGRNIRHIELHTLNEIVACDGVYIVPKKVVIVALAFQEALRLFIILMNGEQISAIADKHLVLYGIVVYHFFSFVIYHYLSPLSSRFFFKCFW